MISRDRIKVGISRVRLRLELRRSARSVAVLVVAAGAGFLSLGAVLRNLEMQWPWQDHFTVRVAVDDASGVVPGKQQVRVAGIPAGKITDSALVDGRAVLTLKVEGEFGPIYRNARARLRPQSPLQDLYLDIETRGHPSAGELGSAVLPARRTQTQVQAGEVLDVFSADTRERMGTLIDELGSGLDDNGAELRQAFAEVTPFLRALQRLTRETGQRQAITRRLVHNLRALTDELGRRDRQLSTLVEDASATVAQTAAAKRQLGELISELPSALQRLPRSFSTLRGALDQLDPALDALRPTAEALEPGLESLRAFARQANPALAALRQPVASLRPLARQLGPTARDLRSAVTKLAPQAPSVDHVTRSVDACLFPLERFFQWTPSIFKLSDSRGVVPRGEGTVGTETAGGLIHDPNVSIGASCADGGGGR